MKKTKNEMVNLKGETLKGLVSLKLELSYKNPDLHLMHKKVGSKLKDQKELASELFLYKTSCGSERPCERDIDYYIKASAILFNTIENPLSLTKLSSLFSRMKKGKVRPPKRHLGSRSLIKKLVLYLVELNLLRKQGDKYCANEKGKKIFFQV